MQIGLFERLRMRSRGIAAAVGLVAVLSFAGCSRGEDDVEYPDERTMVNEGQETAYRPDRAASHTVPAGSAGYAPAVPPGAVLVTLREMMIEMPSELPAGRSTLHVRNLGNMRHNLAIQGPNVSLQIERDLRTDEVATIAVDLPPGTYQVYSPVSDDRQQGMSRQLVVR